RGLDELLLRRRVAKRFDETRQRVVPGEAVVGIERRARRRPPLGATVDVRVRAVPAARAPHRAARKAQTAERADDLRLHVLDLALEGHDALVDGGLLRRVGLEVGVAVEALRRLRELPALLEDHGLVEDRGGI